MASLSISSTAVSSFCGTRITAKPNSFSSKSLKVAPVKAKYGDESVYFDLKDIGNTTGNWDVYGSDSPSPYNGFQSKFFETFAGAFSKRGVLLKVLLLGGGATLGHFSATTGGDLLPIVKGPQQPPTPGPRGKL